MNFKNIFGAFAIAAIFATATSSNAAVTVTVDSGDGNGNVAYTEGTVLNFSDGATITLSETETDQTAPNTFTVSFLNDTATGLDLVATVNRFTTSSGTSFAGFFEPTLKVTNADGSVVLFDEDFSGSTPPLAFASAVFGGIAANEVFKVVLDYTGVIVKTSSQVFDVTISAVPLPAGLLLLLSGLGGLAFVGRRRVAA